MTFGGRVYLGRAERGDVFAPPEVAVMLLGPPRSGKSSCVVMPNVASHAGAVVAASTKPDVLEATWRVRRDRGRCMLFDPSGTVQAPEGVERVQWSPLVRSADWDGAVSVARAMVGGSHQHSSAGDSAHWTERAEALLAPMFHAAALSGLTVAEACSWVERHDLGPALAILERWDAGVGATVLEGIARTASRERASIFSSAAGILAPYRSASVRHPEAVETFDAAGFVDSTATLYVCAPGHHQALLAPLVVGAISDVRSAAYGRATRLVQAGAADGAASILLALDEAANIAPLPDLPAIASEGGSQGLLSLVCLQDLSQARRRWGPAADGFFTLFGAKVVLAGINDRQTLELISLLAGEEEAVVRSHSSNRSAGQRSGSVTVSLRTRPRMAPDAVAKGRPGRALLLRGAQPPSEVGMVPWPKILQASPPSRARRLHPRVLSPRARREAGREWA